MKRQLIITTLHNSGIALGLQEGKGKKKGWLGFHTGAKKNNTKKFKLKRHEFQNICLYETGQVAVSACIISSNVRWRRILYE
jgi:hypothetical protein